jgi:hypothetical protein
MVTSMPAFQVLKFMILGAISGALGLNDARSHKNVMLSTGLGMKRNE